MTNKKALLLISFVVIAVMAFLALSPGHQNTALAKYESEAITIAQTTTTETSTTIPTIEYANYSIYLPQGMDYKTSHPIVVAFSPSADAASMIATWKNVADRHQWIVYASKTFKNGISIGNPMLDVLIDLAELEKKYPINNSRIIVTGFSGGAMFSHAFAYFYPQNVSAIVLNTGMISQIYYQNATYFYYYPKNKTAVFIASPTDFRYEQMKQDKILLESLGWKTRWIEFTGGHTIAPESAYEEAAKWLENE